MTTTINKVNTFTTDQLTSKMHDYRMHLRTITDGLVGSTGQVCGCYVHQSVRTIDLSESHDEFHRLLRTLSGLTVEYGLLLVSQLHVLGMESLNYNSPYAYTWNPEPYSHCRWSHWAVP